MKQLSLILVLSLAVVGLAQPGGGGGLGGPEVEVEVLNPPDTPLITSSPPFVSGTCVEVFASASKSCYPWILSGATMTVNSDDIPVPAYPGQGFAGGLFRLDSTHYPHNTLLQFKMTAHYQSISEPWNTRTVSSPIRTTTTYNTCVTSDHPSFNLFTDAPALQAASTSNYVVQQYRDECSDTVFASRVQSAQFIHWHTHGGQRMLLCGRYQNPLGADLITIDKVEDAMESRPQFVPPCNLIVLQCCVPFDPTESIESGWGLYATAFLTPVQLGTRDRAFQFFRGMKKPDGEEITSAFTNVDQLYSGALYALLPQGYQLWVARDNAASVAIQMLSWYYLWLDPPEYDPNAPATFPAYFEFLRNIWPILGDNTMTLHGIYRDEYSNTNDLRWWSWMP